MFQIKTLFTIALLVLGMAVKSQESLMIEGATGAFYLNHKVAPKENWYSIGRLFNISPKELAAYNKLSMTQPLKIGQDLKVPLTASNFDQQGQSAADESLVPLYHKVKEKEWMFRISTTYNKVPIASLESWNHIKNDQLKAGMNVVVGYLKVKTSLSAFSGKAVSPVVAKVETPAPVKQEPVNTKPEPPVKTEPAKTEPVKVEPAVVKNDPPKQVVETTQVKTVPAPVVNLPNTKGGAFKRLYEESGKSIAGNAGVFKSTSGWNDGKYYALINDVPVGTIVKISYSTTNKSVYAKVLGQLPEMRESQGLSVRLSDAAAAELGAENGKFYVEVKY